MEPEPKPDDPIRRGVHFLDTVAKWKDRWETVGWLGGWVVAIAGWIGVPSVLLTLGAWFRAAGATTADIVELLVHSFVLTAPLTIAVAILAYLVANKAFSNILVFGFTATVVLAGAAYLSNRLGVGQAMDWHKIVAEILPETWKAAPNITILIFAPLALLSAYYHLYTFWPFVLSLAAGLVLGLSVSDRKTA